MCFSVALVLWKHTFIHQPSHFFTELVNVKRQGWLSHVGAWVEIFSHENGLKFSKKSRYFSEKECFQKKDLLFLRGALDTAFICGDPGCMPFAPFNLPLRKWREAYWCYFSVLVFPSPPWKFFAAALECSLILLNPILGGLFLHPILSGGGQICPPPPT